MREGVRRFNCGLTAVRHPLTPTNVPTRTVRGCSRRAELDGIRPNRSPSAQAPRPLPSLSARSFEYPDVTARPRRPTDATASDLVDAQQPLLVLGVDPGDDLDVRLQAGAPQLVGQQRVDLEDARGVVDLHLDADRALLALGNDPDLVDRGRARGVDVREPTSPR